MFCRRDSVVVQKHNNQKLLKIENHHWFIFCNTKNRQQTHFLRSNSWNEKFVWSFIYWHSLWFKSVKEIETTI